MTTSQIRYSRWALLAGFAALVLAINAGVMCLVDLGPMYRWTHRTFARPELVDGLLFIGAMGWGPVSVLLGGLALRGQRRDSALRGQWIARTAIQLGSIGTAVLAVAVIVLIGKP